MSHSRIHMVVGILISGTQLWAGPRSVVNPLRFCRHPSLCRTANLPSNVVYKLLYPVSRAPTMKRVDDMNCPCVDAVS